MTMHLDDFITFISTAKKPVREYNVRTGETMRGCDIYLPPDTEYEFGFKNNSFSRRRVDIFIDGTKTIDSLIVDRYTEINLERFFDTNKKFKTATKGNSKVSDPTNPEIGKIRIEVHREFKKDPVYIPTRRIAFHHSTLRGCSSKPCSYSTEIGTLSASSYINPVEQDLSLCDAQPSNLATVEGNESGQKLIKTSWDGDTGELLVFNYNLLEKSCGTDVTHKFCTSCGNKCELNHKFCSKCGSRI
jgi:hypothetical protein